MQRFRSCYDGYYRAGTSRMTDLLEAQSLYQQALDAYTDAFANHQNKPLEYRHAVGKRNPQAPEMTSRRNRRLRR